MTRSQPSARADRAAHRQHRSNTLLAALTLGLPLAAGILSLIHYGPLAGNETVRRYVQHEVEYAEVVMFCCALGALLYKLLRCWTERAALRTEMVPPWDGKTIAVAEAGSLLAGLNQMSRRRQGTFLGCRIGNVLDFLRSRGSAAELDDQLRALADNDALALEGSYGLTRFIVWAIPILGFLGTVLGITRAISGVTPERLENDLSAVTDGLALAFDCTALALGLTMVIMFISFVVERAEQGILETVDRFVERELAHRFERSGAKGEEFIEVVRQNTQVLVQATEQLVQNQVDLWSQALAHADRRRDEVEQHQQERLTAALQHALEYTVETHEKRLAALEKQAVDRGADLLQKLATVAAAVRDTGREQQAALAQITDGLAGHTDALTHLLDGEQQLLRLQDLLTQNLTTLAGAGAFEQAVHSLTAAIHLLSARTAAPAASGTGRPGARPGAAA